MDLGRGYARSAALADEGFVLRGEHLTERPSFFEVGVCQFEIVLVVYRGVG